MNTDPNEHSGRYRDLATLSSTPVRPPRQTVCQALAGPLQSDSIFRSITVKKNKRSATDRFGNEVQQQEPLGRRIQIAR